ncbi:hypothetical protein, conserved [Trypanosoma brucei brucei TREU927]|uniref:Uncharacterized protein n=1 Tax=Trypanosoma brucei brucei (strain 927/4 GUTat10.1) TaxID=185431 RepID=Q384S5_TRYB2|nr:hypothetical protein, conserved [Trypanosoma brucei brucei TREU927]EAN79706.1 hypothetical protein, conserved [Trypanosoma brucei brucei TREU927]
MEDSNEVALRGLRTAPGTRRASPQGDTKLNLVPEPPLPRTGASMLTIPVVKLLHCAVRDVVEQQAPSLKCSLYDDEEVTNEVVNHLLHDTAVDGVTTLDVLTAKWRQVLSESLNANGTVSDAERATLPVTPGPSEAECNEILEPVTDAGVILSQSPASVNVLRLDCDSELSLDGLHTEDSQNTHADAHEFIDACLNGWLKDGHLVPGEKRNAFVSALRVVSDADSDVVVSDSHWDFWRGSLLACLEQPTIAWEAADLIVAFLCSRCSSTQKLLLVESVTRMLRQYSQQNESGRSPEVLLHLLHKLVLRLAGDIDLLLDDELGGLFHHVIESVIEHITYFGAVDPQGQWLKELLVRPALTRHVIRLPETQHALVSKLLDAFPTTHAVGLTLVMLPLWVQKHNTKGIFASLLSCVVNGVMTGTVRRDMVGDALVCIRRCARGLHYSRRYEYVNQICNILASSGSDTRVEDKNCGNDRRLWRLGLPLLLVFSVPSGHDCDKGYRLLPGQLRQLEKCLLRRTELWSEESPEDREIISSFWCEMLHWYAVQLRKVVKRVVKTVGSGVSRSAVPWDERHLVSISTVTPAWRELENILTNRGRHQPPDYTTVLQCMCSHSVLATSPQYFLQQNVQVPQRDRYALLNTKHEIWWLLMRWCSSAPLRHELFLATGRVLKLLTNSESTINETLLIVPVEELEGEVQVLHTIPTEEMEKRRRIALFQSIRLWIAALTPPVDTTPLTRWDVAGAFLQQIKRHWIDREQGDTSARLSFGDDSLLLLLCVYTIGTLTGAVLNGSGTHPPDLDNALRRILLDRRGFDPVQQLLLYLTTCADCSGLTDILAHRFDAVSEPLWRVEEYRNAKPTVSCSPLPVGQKELHLFKKHVGESLDQSYCASDGYYSSGMEQVLMLILQLHEGNIASAAASLGSFPLSTWEAYGGVKELSARIVESIRETHPHMEGLLRLHGVDLYYLSLLCTSRWLRDPWRAADVARTSVDIFVRRGWKAWENTVAESLCAYITMIHEQFQRHQSLLLCPWEETAVFPVSYFWASCITNKFTLVRSS